MSVFTVFSKKEQVAEAIRKQITGGKIAAGTRLDSVRDLAGKFSVSPKVIVDAFDILERNRFVRREAGKGVFVGRNSESAALEVCVLGFGIDASKDEYFNSLARIALPPRLREGFNFVVRVMPPSRDFNDVRFREELRRLEQYMNPDCLLISAPSLTRGQIEICLKLGAPTIFIGDFSDGQFPELAYNQIAGDNAALGRSMARQVIAKERCGELTVFSGSHEHYFYREFCRGVREEAGLHGVGLNLVEFPKGVASVIPEPRRRELYREKLGAAELSCPCLNAGLPIVDLLNGFRECGLAAPVIYGGHTAPESLDFFYDAVYAAIRNVMATPGECRRMMIEINSRAERIS